MIVVMRSLSRPRRGRLACQAVPLGNGLPIISSAVRAARDLAAREQALERRGGVLVDDEPAVLVVEDGVRVDRLDERVDAAPVTPQHVGQRDLGVLGGDARRVEPHGGAAVGREDPLAALDLVEDRLRHGVARPERVGELLAVCVQEDCAVRASSPGSSSPASSRARRRRSGGTGERPGRGSPRPRRARSASPRRSRSDGSSSSPRDSASASSGHRRRARRHPRRARPARPSPRTSPLSRSRPDGAL